MREEKNTISAQDSHFTHWAWQQIELPKSESKISIWKQLKPQTPTHDCWNTGGVLKLVPLFHECLLRTSPKPSFLLKKGPSSDIAPAPIDEHPGPASSVPSDVRVARKVSHGFSPKPHNNTQARLPHLSWTFHGYSREHAWLTTGQQKLTMSYPPFAPSSTQL